MPENADIHHNEENVTHCTSVSKTSTSAAKLVITALPLWSIRRNGCCSSHPPQAWCISLLLPAHWKGKLRCVVQMEMSKIVIIPLWGLLESPHPEHCVQFLAPTIKKEVKVLEHVQSRTTTLVKTLEGMSCVMACEEWWQTLGLSGLEKRQLSTNLIATASWGGHGERAELFTLTPSDRMWE